MVGIGKDEGRVFSSFPSSCLCFGGDVFWKEEEKRKHAQTHWMKMLSNNIKYKTKNTSDIRRTTFIIYINHLSSIWTRDYLQ
jgi:hypothetical protein